MRNKVVFIILYFGKIPAYFDLWLKSAEKNPEYDFLIYSDLPFDLDDNSNVRQIHMSFNDVRDKIQKKLNRKICLQTPYKLCDYRPAFGYVFQEDIVEYDFWGFLDIDLILGKISNFVTDDLLDKNDKLFYQGHFSLFRNCEMMNTLFLKCYSHVLNWKYAFSTEYPCHFDENGTVVWAHEVDSNSGIRFDTKWCFLDTPVLKYEIYCQGKEGYVVWSNGILVFYSFDGEINLELMYIHLQKRTMLGNVSSQSSAFAIARTSFFDLCNNINDEYQKKDIDKNNINEFVSIGNDRRRKEIIKNIQNGAIKARVYRKIFRWKKR